MAQYPGNRSPGFTPIDFFLWAYVKNLARRAKLHHITCLKQKIIDAIDIIDESMLPRTLQKVEYHLDVGVLYPTKGIYIEVY